MNIAINGFGKIGRSFLRAAIKKGIIKNFDRIVINDFGDIENMAYLFKYDSPDNTNLDIRIDKDILIIDKKEIQTIHEPEIKKLPWKNFDIDLVIESTGKFSDKEEIKDHFIAGAKKILVSSPSKYSEITLVKGLNFWKLTKEHKIISIASCTTNCIAPLIKVLDENFGIKNGFFTTTHAYTSDQKLLDTYHKDFRRGRSAAMNIIPTTSGAARSIGELMPHLKGKFNGYSLRVPVSNGSIATLFLNLKKNTDKEQINKLFLTESMNKMKEIIDYSKDPLVSGDIINNSNSCIFDSSLTECLDNSVIISGWYDNEWAYSNRLVDAVSLILMI